MIGSSTASTISITTPPIATISSGSRMVAICHRAALHLGAELARPRGRASAAAGRSARPAAQNIASRPGKRFLPASAEASGAPSRTCTSASIASARIARLDSVSAAACKRLQDRHAGAGQHRQRAGEARRVVAAREPADQRQARASRRRSARGRPRCAAISSSAPTPPTSASSTSQPQLRRKALMREHRDRQRRQRALASWRTPTATCGTT